MNARELFQAGKLNEAVQALGAEVRDNPTDVRRRTFLFELLCFQGEYDRAEKHLNLLADATPDAQLGAVLYFSALHAERAAAETFQKKDYPVHCRVLERPRRDAERKAFRIVRGRRSAGGRAAGSIRGRALICGFRLRMSNRSKLEAPKRLRDLLWIPALVRTGPAFKGTELGEVLLPVLAPFSCQAQRRQYPAGPRHRMGGGGRASGAVRTKGVRRGRGRSADSGDSQDGVYAPQPQAAS